MPTLRKLTSRIWTAITPSTSPTSSSAPSPTSPPVSSFGVISGRKEGGIAVTRLDQDQHHTRSFSLMTYATNSSKETVEDGVAKPLQRRTSRFREELWDQ